MDTNQLKTRYFGSLAETYDRERVGTPLWEAENLAMRKVLAGLKPGSTVLDVPVGTGRFAPMYKEFGLVVSGIDASEEMLRQAAEKGKCVGLNWDLQIGDVGKLPFEDEAFDTALCIRFLNWIDTDFFTSAVGELARVARSQVVFGVRSFRPRTALRMSTLSGVKNYALQWKWRFYQFRTRARFRIHEYSTVADALSIHGLNIVQKIPIKTKKSGFDYSFYVAVCN